MTSSWRARAAGPKLFAAVCPCSSRSCGLHSTGPLAASDVDPKWMAECRERSSPLHRGGDFRRSLTDTAIDLPADYRFDKPRIAGPAYTGSETAKTFQRPHKEDELDGCSDSAVPVFAYRKHAGVGRCDDHRWFCGRGERPIQQGLFIGVGGLHLRASPAGDEQDVPHADKHQRHQRQRLRAGQSVQQRAESGGAHEHCGRGAGLEWSFLDRLG